MKKKNIEFVSMLYLRGPNVWAYRPVIEAWVDIGELEDYPSNTIPGLYERLSQWLPTLVEHRCSVGERGGFLQRLREGTWPGHILEHVTLELQSLAGMPGGLGRARETSVRGVYKVIVRAWHEPLTRAALWAEVKDRLDKPATGLSGGQQQRLCIARSIAVRPEVLLLDEPTSALDPISTLKIEELIDELKQDFTIAIVTHNMQQAARCADQVGFMYLGELVELGSAEQIFTAPREQRTREYITGRFG